MDNLMFEYNHIISKNFSNLSEAAKRDKVNYINAKPFPSIVLLISYGVSFYLLSILSQKLSLAIIYASWAGMGVFSIAILSYIFYNQTLNWQSIIGLFLIVIGVTIVNMYKAQPTF